MPRFVYHKYKWAVGKKAKYQSRLGWSLGNGMSRFGAHPYAYDDYLREKYYKDGANMIHDGREFFAATKINRFLKRNKERKTVNNLIHKDRMYPSFGVVKNYKPQMTYREYMIGTGKWDYKYKKPEDTYLAIPSAFAYPFYYTSTKYLPDHPKNIKIFKRHMMKLNSKKYEKIDNQSKYDRGVDAIRLLVRKRKAKCTSC